MFVCVCACLSASITSELHVLIAFGCVAIRYILPVLWMTSCLQIMAKNRPREKLNTVLKMSRQGQHGFHIGVYTKRSTGGHHQIGGKVWYLKKVKVAHTRLPKVGFRSWSRFLTVSLQVTWVINPAVGCHYFPPEPRPLVDLATPKRAATNFAARWTEARWVWTVCLRLLPDCAAAAIWTKTLLRLSPAR